MKLKKLLSLLASVVVATSASTSVIACGTFISGEKGTEQKRFLKQDLRVTDLGDFDTTPSKEELLKRISEKNPAVDIKSITLFIPEFDPGTVRVKPTADGVYAQGDYVDVVYSVGNEQKRQDLRILFTRTDLGAINSKTP